MAITENDIIDKTNPDHADIPTSLDGEVYLGGSKAAGWRTRKIKTLAVRKSRKRDALKEEAVLRMSAEVSALSTFEMVEFLVALWPMLDTASAPANITAVRTIYIYAKQKLTWINGATKAELQAYDPTTDQGWP